MSLIVPEKGLGFAPMINKWKMHNVLWDYLTLLV
jgi:hypothetical protein